MEITSEMFWNNENIKNHNISPQNMRLHQDGNQAEIMYTSSDSSGKVSEVVLSSLMNIEQATLTLKEYAEKWLITRMKDLDEKVMNVRWD